MRFLVFQHIALEHPGIFREFFQRDGIEWDAVELDEGQPIPPFDGYDALWVMGGPMDVWEQAEHPWLVPEQRAIREAVVERGMPYMGICLGHQLLGAALGGRVAKAAHAEVGVLDVELTEAGHADSMFEGLPANFKALQWHGAEVSVAPAGAIILARSPLCGVQALRYGRHAYGMQFHTELTNRTVGEWGKVPAYSRALEQTLGPGALPRFEAEAGRHMADFNRNSERIYRNFIKMMRPMNRP